MRNHHIWKVLILVSLLCNAACGNREKQQDAEEQAPTHAVLTLTPQELVLYDDYPASIQGEEVIEIRARAEGYLEQLYVDEGASVKKGQALFKISSPQYEQELRSAEAAIATAKADVDAANMMVRKTRPLVEKEIISAYELEAADYAFQAKKAALAQANALLENARANLGFTVVRSPSDGIIGNIPYRKGSLVSMTSTSPLTTLSANRAMYVYFSLDEKQLLDFNRRFEGTTIQQKLKKLPPVLLRLADGTSYAQSGVVETASGLINAGTGSINFRASFPNESTILQSGGSAVIRIPRQLDSALVIPQASTYEMQNKTMVYLLNKDNRVISRAIVATASSDGKQYVVESGLSAGDKVVISGISSLKDSLLIVPKQAALSH